MSQPTRRDELLAQRKTQAEAERYPLLARLGVARTWTAQAQADKREQSKIVSAANEAARLRAEIADIVRYKYEVLVRGGRDAIAAVLERAAATSFNKTTRDEFWVWYSAVCKLRSGKPVVEPPPSVTAKPRHYVAPGLVIEVLRRFPTGASAGQIEDALGAEHHILDVLRALVDLRDAGVVQPRQRGGFRLTAEWLNNDCDDEED